MAGLLEAEIFDPETFDPMQACRIRMARICLARVRTLRFGSALIVCISLLMVLTPSAHGFSAHGFSAYGSAMTPPATTAAGAMMGGTGGDGDHSSRTLVLNDAMAAADDNAAILVKAANPGDWCHVGLWHGGLCCAGGDPSGNTGSAGDACMAACCSAIMIACRHHLGVLVSAQAGPLLPIPPSASRGGIHPPPRSDRMI